MENNSAKTLQYYTVITSIKSKDPIIELLQQNGAKGINVTYGHGSAKKGVLAQAFGFDTEEKKLIVTCLIPTENAVTVTKTLYESFNFNKANTGIAFGIKVDALLF